MFYWRTNFSYVTSANKGRLRLAPVALWLTIFFCSCSTKDDVYRGYFPIDSLVNTQIKYLTKAKANVKKISTLNGQRVEATLAPQDTLGWITELDIFRELELINKSVNRSAYTVEDGLPDNKSNLKRMVIEGKESVDTQKDLAIQYLHVYYQDNRNKVRKIEAELRESNVLYKGSRLLRLEFQDIRDTLVLTSYQMEGGQKMFLGDSVAYAIHGIITLPD